MVWIALGMGLTGLSLGIWAWQRYRQRKKLENLHMGFARERGLKTAYLNPKDMQIYGHYREYPVQITADTLAHSSTVARNVLKVSLPMINPNRKCLRISVGGIDYPEFDRLVVLDRPIQVQHDLGDWLRMESNDIFFTSLILTDDIKISLYELFKEREALLLYIQDDELAMISPTLLFTASDQAFLGKQLDILCDIKDELNQVKR